MLREDDEGEGEEELDDDKTDKLLKVNIEIPDLTKKSTFKDEEMIQRSKMHFTHQIPHPEEVTKA